MKTIKVIFFLCFLISTGGYLIIFLLIFNSCSEANHTNLAGAWEIDELKVTMHSLRNSDRDTTVEMNAANWEKITQSRNIRTFFNADGTYHSVHKNLRDSIVYDPAGTWKITGDSLVIQDTFPERITYRYKIKVGDGFAEFWGVEDMDQDGKTDDDFYSRQRKVK